MTEKLVAPQLPERLRDAIESVVRIANAEKFVIIGMVLRHDPPAVAIMRNTTDDPAELFHAAGNIVSQKEEDGRIIEERILPVS
jgi:hypothetical protein